MREHRECTLKPRRIERSGADVLGLTGMVTFFSIMLGYAEYAGLGHRSCPPRARGLSEKLLPASCVLCTINLTQQDANDEGNSQGLQEGSCFRGSCRENVQKVLPTKDSDKRLRTAEFQIVTFEDCFVT